MGGDPAAARPSGASSDPGYRFALALARAGPRPAGSAAERRAHARVERRFRAAGLRIGHDRFRVPGKGRSRNVVGDPRHAGGLPRRPRRPHRLRPSGARRRRQRVGGRHARRARPAPQRHPAHLRRLADRHRRRGAALHRRGRPPRRARRRAARQAPQARPPLRALARRGRPRPRLPPPLARRAPPARRRGRGDPRRPRGGPLGAATPAAGNSDHREFALAGLPAAKLGVPDDPCRHTACDRPGRLQAGTFPLVRGVVERLLSQTASSAEGSGRLR